MLYTYIFTTFISILLVASASPLSRRQASREKTCVVPSLNGTGDDSSAISLALTQCSSNAVIEFSEGLNYNVYKPIKATNLSNVEIAVNGNLHLPQDIAGVQ